MSPNWRLPFPDPKTLALEDQLLLAGCKDALSEHERGFVGDALRRDDPSFLDGLFRAAAANRVDARLARHFLRAGAVGPVRRRMIETIARVASRVGHLRASLDRVLPRIVERHGEIVLLRGAAYFCRMYRGPVVRAADDIDLLVRPPSSLSLSGTFRDHYPLDPAILAVLPRDVGLELHADLSVCATWGLGGCDIDTEAVWGRSRPVLAGKHVARRLQVEDEILYLCFHNLCKGLSLYRLVDLRDLIAFDPPRWDVVQGRAEAWGLTRAVWVHVQALEWVFGASIDLPCHRFNLSAAERMALGSLIDGHAILHDPNPASASGHSSAAAHVRRSLLLAATLVSRRNAWKLGLAPWVRLGLSAHRWFLTSTPPGRTTKKAIDHIRFSPPTGGQRRHSR